MKRFKTGKKNDRVRFNYADKTIKNMKSNSMQCKMKHEREILGIELLTIVISVLQEQPVVTIRHV